MQKHIQYILFALLLLMTACSSKDSAGSYTPGMEAIEAQDTAENAPTLLPNDDEN